MVECLLNDMGEVHHHPALSREIDAYSNVYAGCREGGCMAQCGIEYHQGQGAIRPDFLQFSDQGAGIDFTLFPAPGSTNQCFCRNAAPCPDVDLRLVVARQLVRFDGFVEIDVETVIGLCST